MYHTTLGHGAAKARVSVEMAMDKQQDGGVRARLWASMAWGRFSEMLYSHRIENQLGLW